MSQPNKFLLNTEERIRVDKVGTNGLLVIKNYYQEKDKDKNHGRLKVFK